MAELNIKELVILSQYGNKESLNSLIDMFNCLLVKNSYINGNFDMDCYQELVYKFIYCIKKFKFQEPLIMPKK